MEIGHIIAKYRTEMGLNQKDFARRLNVSPAAVGLWEVNKRIPSPSSLIDIADFFNISMDTLFAADRKNTAYMRAEGNALSPDCERLIGYYGDMNEESREILMGEARKLIREQRLEEKGKALPRQKNGHNS